LPPLTQEGQAALAKAGLLLMAAEWRSRTTDGFSGAKPTICSLPMDPSCIHREIGSEEPVFYSFVPSLGSCRAIWAGCDQKGLIGRSFSSLEDCQNVCGEFEGINRLCYIRIYCIFFSL